MHQVKERERVPLGLGARAEKLDNALMGAT